MYVCMSEGVYIHIMYKLMVEVNVCVLVYTKFHVYVCKGVLGVKVARLIDTMYTCCMYRRVCTCVFVLV